ncbi:MAG: AMP-binding protein [Myxococcaceae bacterium]|nr:AMP-binding protein [Myxococcaceae bacterium]
MAPTVVELLERQATRRPDAAAYVFHPDDGGPPVQRTWRELLGRARAIGAALEARTPRPTRALLQYAPGLEYLDALFGCACAGVTVMPASPPDPMRLARSLPRLKAVLEVAQSSLVLTTQPLMDLLQLVPEAQVLSGFDFMATDVVDDAAAARWQAPARDHERLAMIQFTSGTTATPRGVALREQDLVGNVERYLEHLKLPEGCVGMIWLPLFHDMGLIGGIFTALALGMTLHTLSPVAFLRTPRRWLEVLTATRARYTGGPNFGYELAVRKTTPEERARFDLSALEIAATGAEPVRSSTLVRFGDAFAACGFRRRAFMACYGLAEATLFAAGSPRDTHPTVLSVDAGALLRGERAAPVPGAPVRELVGRGAAAAALERAIVHPETLARVPPGALGEIWLRGPGVGVRYLGDDGLSARTFGARTSDGDGPFLRTGDQGFELDGELFITGRLKDLVIVRGVNVYPSDVEAAVDGADPAVRPGSSAAFALEGPLGERLAVVLEVAESTQDFPRVASAVRGHLQQELGLAAEVVCLLPPRAILKTSSGKVQRGGTRAALLAGELQVLHRWEGATPSEAVSQARDAGSVFSFLVGWVAKFTGRDAKLLAGDQTLSSLGLDSLAAATLLWDLEHWLQATVPITIAVGDPTLDELCARVAKLPGGPS